MAVYFVKYPELKPPSQGMEQKTHYDKSFQSRLLQLLKKTFYKLIISLQFVLLVIKLFAF